MLPIVYTPMVGKAIERYSHEYRRPRGVFLSVDHPVLDMGTDNLRLLNDKMYLGNRHARVAGSATTTSSTPT
jgi:Malic enzyme, N-terminal domain